MSDWRQKKLRGFKEWLGLAHKKKASRSDPRQLRLIVVAGGGLKALRRSQWEKYGALKMADLERSKAYHQAQELPLWGLVSELQGKHHLIGFAGVIAQDAQHSLCIDDRRRIKNGFR